MILHVIFKFGPFGPQIQPLFPQDPEMEKVDIEQNFTDER